MTGETPPQSAESLELVRVTDPDVLRQVWLNNKEHFAPEMLDELWLEKAALRTGLDLGPGVEHKIWILVPKGKGNDPSCILSSVHTYDRPGLMSHRSKGNEAGVELKDIMVAYVLLVFTPREHRKKGYAKTTLRMLREHLSNQTSPAIDLSFLYSSVGRDFYSASGWPAVQSRELVMEVPGLVFPELPVDTSGTKPCEPEDITVSNLQVIMDRDIELLRSEMLSHALATPQGPLVAAIVPEARIFRGQLAIALFTNSKVVKVDKPITKIGVRLVDHDKPSGGDAFIIWTYHLQSKLLLILRIRYRTIHQLQCLLKEAMKEAQEWSMDKLAVWGLDDDHAIQATGIPNGDRTTAWSCIGHIRQEDQVHKDTVLLANEAYIWGL
ncbi:MAG: hypothetical protein J3Q66DRAFT_328662 [Benniella sp.]|nr:MAG: hypothetical protein J3Q66DRAFT_328662 [Benniella sp.]